jgi:hypothetical protein
MVGRDLAVPAVPYARSIAGHLLATTSRQYRRAGHIEGGTTFSHGEGKKNARRPASFWSLSDLITLR